MDKHSVKRIFGDIETLIQIEDRNYWLWVASEPNLDACLMMLHLLRERTIFVCYRFFKQSRVDMIGNRY